MASLAQALRWHTLTHVSTFTTQGPRKEQRCIRGSASAEPLCSLHICIIERASHILDIQMGMVDRCVDLSRFSQYPHGKDICVPPLTGIEVLDARVGNSILVVECRFSVKIIALTIEEVIGKSRQLVKGMCETCGLTSTAS